MKIYRIWITKEEFIDVEAACPSEALKQAGVRWYWDITIVK